MRKSKEMQPEPAHGKVELLLGDLFSRNSAVLTELAHSWRDNQSVCVRYFGDDALLIDKESRVFFGLGVERMNVSDSWALAQAQIMAQRYNVVVLLDFAQALFDEHLTENLSLKQGDTKAVAPSTIVNWLLENKPPGLRLLITGQDASVELLEYADEVRICSPSRDAKTEERRHKVGIVESIDLSSLFPNTVGFLSSALQRDGHLIDPNYEAAAD